MKKILYIIISLLFIGTSYGQQDAMFTHYMFNTQSINPAYAGSRDALTFTVLHRSQWVGFNGAPTTQTFTIHTPLFNDDLGFGLSVLNDKIGPLNMSSVFVDFSYKIAFDKGRKLAFGLKGGSNMMRAGLGSLEVNETNDMNFQTDIKSSLLPNFGFGLYYYAPKYYIGLSAPKIMENSFDQNLQGSNESRHYFIISGFIVNLNEDLKLKPTSFIKATVGAPMEADITAILIVKEKLWFGPMFRTGDALGMLAGVFPMPQLEIGYSFDWSYGLQTGRYNYGSHEIMMRYDFVYKDKKKIKSPRYF